MGKPCEVSCRKALLKLDKRDMIKLPKAKSFPKIRGIPADVSDVAKIDGDISKLGEIKVIQIEEDKPLIFEATVQIKPEVKLGSF